jgi:trehalose 6-phosphate phosphatase
VASSCGFSGQIAKIFCVGVSDVRPKCGWAGALHLVKAAAHPHVTVIMRPPAPSIWTENQAIALFLDFDGTLVELALKPDLVVLPANTRSLLAQLQARLGGALAIISGRDIADLDAHLAPLRLAVAGVHGRVRRTANGDVVTCETCRGDTAAVALAQLVEEALKPLLLSDSRLLLEHKVGAVALHFRSADDMADVCRATMASAAAKLPNVVVRHGKCVVEVIAGEATKGTAVAEFLVEPTFRGRTPVYIGDDDTDEAAFAVVNAAGGVSIKVGAAATAARHWLRDPAAVVTWLSALATDLERTAPCLGS